MKVAEDLWTLTRGRPQIDPNDLAEAVARQAAEDELDYRTRMLIHDCMDALQHYWGPARLQQWLEQCPVASRIDGIWREEYDKVGFPSLTKRIMDKTRTELIEQFLEHLGRSIRHETTIHIAGSVALILPGYLERHTDDIDVIDDLPRELRENHDLMQELQDSYGLQLGHVQSHYFPAGWRERVHSLGPHGRINVFLVDVYDVFLSKLFSNRIKDMGDLRILKPQLDKDILTRKLKDHCQSFLTTPRLLQMAQDNWQVLFGEPLPMD